jgi:type 1 glutamine amidotransferase
MASYRNGFRPLCGALLLALFLGLDSAVPASAGPSPAPQTTVEYLGNAGPGKGKRIVLVTGDEEYRSEEAMPMLAKILAGRFGFTCTVLFAINPAGQIDPETLDNIPGLAALKDADLMILFARFRELPDSSMKRIVDFMDAGKPIIGIRTATHAFNYVKNTSSPYAKYSYQSSSPQGGFGRLVLGQTWVNHWGNHGSQSTRGLIRADAKDLPILRGVKDLWGPTDVYEAASMPAGTQVLVDGQVLTGMKPTDPPLANKATMPICWTRTYAGAGGKSGRVFASTLGAATDFQNEDLRRLFVNASFWCMGMEDSIPAKANVDYMQPYAPSDFGFGGQKKGVKPADLNWSVPTALPRAAWRFRRAGPLPGIGIRLDGKRITARKEVP